MIFLRYIIQFFFFACVLGLLFIPVYIYISKVTLETELNYANTHLKNGILAFDTAISMLNNTVIYTRDDSRFRILKYNPSSIREDPSLLRELRRSFNYLFLSQSLIADAGIIFSDDIILTRQSIFFSPELYSFYGNGNLQCEDLSEDEWKALLVLNRPLLPIMNYQSRDFGSYTALTFAVQWYFSDIPGQNIMYANLPVKNIIPLFIISEGLEKGAVRIFDREENLVLEYFGISHEPAEPCYLLTAQSETIAVRFEVSIPEAVISSRMSPVRSMIIIFIMVSVGFIILISLFFAYKSSEPMRRLLEKINMTKNVKIETDGNIKTGIRGFLKKINLIYTDLGESINAVDARMETTLRTVEQQAHLIRVQAFDNALVRGIYRDDKLQEFFSLFPDFPKQYQLALIQYDVLSDIPIRENAALQLMIINKINIWNKKIYVHAIETSIVLLLPLANSDENWYKSLDSLRNNLNRTINYSLYFSLSDIFNKPEELIKAWRQLQFIHTTPGIDDLVSIMRIKNAADYSGLPINIGIPQMIYNALISGNDTMACAILHECFASLPLSNNNLLPALVFNMLHDMIVLLKLENSELLKDVNIPQYKRGNEYDLFINQFPDSFRQIAKKIKTRKEDDINFLGRKVLDYINERLYDPKLYSVMVMDHFNISQPTLQKLMKIATGKTFLVYVETKRLEKAMHMILERNHTIQEISGQCGFSKTDSFYKAFKKTYGYAPSDTIKKSVEN